jgi:hypothetical protein
VGDIIQTNLTYQQRPLGPGGKMNLEPLVLQYLASQGLFVSPQYSIRGPDGKEWSCPDFVALDFIDREVQVVEVSSSWDLTGLLRKVTDRQNQWFSHLIPQLHRRHVIEGDWYKLVRLFIRKDRVEVVKAEFLGADEIRVEAIEDIVIPWKWPWEAWLERLDSGRPASNAPTTSDRRA